MIGLFENLKQMLQPVYSYSAVNEIVEYCYKTAYQHCRLKGEKLLPLLQKRGLSLRDISMDSISTLFGRSATGEFSQIQRSFAKWNPPIENDGGAAYFLYSLTIRKTEQQITELYAESDHFFFKILTAVSYLLRQKSNERYQKNYFLGKAYIVPKSSFSFTGVRVDEEFLYSIPLEKLKIDKNLFDNLFEIIEKSPEYCKAIPVNALIRRLKEIHAPRMITVEDIKHHYVFDDFSTQNDSENIMNNVLKLTEDKVFNTYVKKQKLTGVEGKAFIKIVADIGRDLTDGGPERNLFNYLVAYLPEVSESEYKVRYKSTLEYLVRFMRTKLLDEVNC